MAYTRTPVQDLKYALLADKRDAVFVTVLRGGAETETWSLVWHYKNGQTGGWWCWSQHTKFSLNCHRCLPFDIQFPWTS